RPGQHRNELGWGADYHGIHRGTEAFERVGDTHDFARDVVDTFAQHRMGHALSRPGSFHLALHDCHFLLEPDAFVIRRAHLLLQLTVASAQLLHRVGVTLFRFGTPVTRLHERTQVVELGLFLRELAL